MKTVKGGIIPKSMALWDKWVIVALCLECMLPYGVCLNWRVGEDGRTWNWPEKQSPEKLCQECGAILQQKMSETGAEEWAVDFAPARFRSNIAWYWPPSWSGTHGVWEVKGVYQDGPPDDENEDNKKNDIGEKAQAKSEEEEVPMAQGAQT